MRARKSSPPTCPACCSIWRNGAPPIRARWRSSIRRPPARWPRRERCSPSLARSTQDGRITDEGRKLRALPLPPRLARMVVDAGARRRGRARRRHRRDPVRARARRRRRRSRRTGSISSAATARAAARTRGGWRSAGRRMRRRAHGRSARVMSRRRDPLARLSRSHRQEPRRGTARSCWPMGAAPTSIRRRRLSREPFLAVAELAGTAAQGRILLAAPITLERDRAALRGPDREPRGHHVRRRVAQPARPPQRSGSARSRWPSDRCGRARARRTRACWPRASRARRRSAAVDQIAQAMARPRDVPAPRGRRRVAGPVRRGARRQRRRLARAVLARQDGAGGHCRPTSFRPRCTRCCRGTCTRRLDAEAPTHFAAPSGSLGADRLRRRGGTEARDPRAGAVRARPASDDRRRQGRR